METKNFDDFAKSQFQGSFSTITAKLTSYANILSGDDADKLKDLLPASMARNFDSVYNRNS